MTAETVKRYEAAVATTTQLVTLIQSESWTWIYAERPQGTVLDWYDSLTSENIGWEEWSHGRVFSQAAELSWWRQARDRYSCRWVSSAAAPSEVPWQESFITSLPEQPERTLLHGEWDKDSKNPPTWSEARIPGHLKYPIAQAEGLTEGARVALQIQHYMGKDGEVVTRLISLELVIPMEVAQNG